MIRLDRARFRDRVYACWLGKTIGGTLGGPFECRQFVNDLEFYDPLPERAAPNDDLDLQLVWLKLLEDHGADPPLPRFADYWLKYLSAYPWNEYGFCQRNLRRGLRPPISGCFENFFVDEEGSPIRSELWACIAPGDPQLAASMAWKDSALDHAGGEGMHAEMFLAAVESAAFVLDDPLTLIRVGLAMIPTPCAISRVVRDAVHAHRSRLRWAAARERIVQQFESGRVRPCNAIVNTGFVILGWLYGKDFGDRLCRAVNCGYDTDCTGATLGALLGILGGTSAIPEEWRQPIGREILLHRFTGDCSAPKSLDELTDRTVALAEKVLSGRSDAVRLGHEDRLPGDGLTLLFRNERAQEALRRDVHSAVEVAGDLEVTLHYNGDPVLHPGIGRMFEVTLARDGRRVAGARIALRAPAEWTVGRHGAARFLVVAPEGALRDRNTITVCVEADGSPREVSYTVLGPGEAQGFAAGQNVPTCPTCHATAGACLCRRPS